MARELTGEQAQGSRNVILITGASSGIGAALARHYAGYGHHLILCARRGDKLDALARECRRAGASEVTAKSIDVCDAGAMRDWLIAQDETSPIDLVIANAGVSGGTGDSSDGEDEAQARQIFAINLDGVLNTIHPLLPRMRERGHGQIALMSSLAAFSGWAGAPAYSASKAAVRIYGEALRGTYASCGIKVNVILPGFVRTPMTDVNPYPMPFIMDTPQAAQRIAAGLDRNKARIALPFVMYWLAYVISIMPGWLVPKVTARAPKKP
jgi:short-subunit dehydrogenase